MQPITPESTTEGWCMSVYCLVKLNQADDRDMSMLKPRLFTCRPRLVTKPGQLVSHAYKPFMFGWCGNILDLIAGIIRFA